MKTSAHPRPFPHQHHRHAGVIGCGGGVISCMRGEGRLSGGALMLVIISRMMRPVGFDWDDDKADTNFAKHGVSFQEAMTVFDDDVASIREDPDHSIGERREIIVGRSDAGRLLLVSFTERDNVIRLINARAATSRERKLYEEKLSKEI